MQYLKLEGFLIDILSYSILLHNRILQITVLAITDKDASNFEYLSPLDNDLSKPIISPHHRIQVTPLKQTLLFSGKQALYMNSHT